MVDHTIEMAAAQYGMAGIQIRPPPQMLTQAAGDPGDGVLMQLAHQLDQGASVGGGNGSRHDGAMKVVVIDDDPTGSQTVHSCPLLLGWDRESLRRGLRHPSPLLFLLADTRALTPEERWSATARLPAIWIKRWLQRGWVVAMCCW